MAKDMTHGRPIRVITAFAVPMFIGSVFQQVYNIVDSMVVGNFVGAGALAAVGSCGSAFSLVLSLVTGLTGGMSVVIAQYFGAGDKTMVRKSFVTSMVVNLIAGLIVTLLGVLLAKPLLLALGTNADIMADAKLYLTILFIGTLANCLYNGISAVLRAMGDSLVPLLVLIAASLINVGLDLWFVLGMGWGVGGVAIATVLSQLISALLAIAYAFWKMPVLRFHLSDVRLERAVVKEIIRIGLPSAISSVGVSISVMFLQRAINHYGSIALAGYVIGGRTESIGMNLSYSIGMAVGTFCGQNIGARDYKRVREGMRAGHLLALAYTLFVGILMFLFARPLAGLFTSDEEAISIAIVYIRVVSVFAPILGLLFVYQNFLRSAGDITPTIWMSVTEILARSALAFLFSWLFGLHGIWWATPIGWTASLAIGIWRMCSGKWKSHILTGKVQEN